MRHYLSGHHPSIEDVVRVRTILMSNAVSDCNWDEALTQIDKALAAVGEKWNNCLACLSLIVPLYRIKSDCLFKLERYNEAAECHEAYTAKSDRLEKVEGLV